MKVFLVGEQFAAARTLETLLAIDDVRVVGVACSEADGSRQVATRADSLKIPVFPGERINQPEHIEGIRRTAPDLGLNVNSLLVFSDDLLSAFPAGAVNFHPGPLPEYAGLHVHQWAMINGEQEHGVTFHRMTGTIDAGDVIMRAMFPIAPSDTGLKLFMRCIQRGVELIGPLIRGMRDGTIASRPQDLRRRVYYGRGPYDWEIDFTWPAARIASLVRALDYQPFESPLGSPWISLEGRRYSVPEVRVVERAATAAAGALIGWTEQQDAIFACGEGTAVVVPRLVADGRSLRAVDVLDARMGRPGLQ